MSIRVDGEEIPAAAMQYELNRLVKFYADHMPPEEIRAQMDALREKAKEQAIGAKLLIRDAQRYDFKIPSSDIEERLNKMVEQAGGAKAFELLLAKQGMTRESMRRTIMQGRHVDLLVGKITEGIPDPSDADMEKHFRDHEHEYRTPPRAQAQHILVKSQSEGQADKQAARSRLADIRRRIDEGADFSEMAASCSECPSGKSTGGSLGWVSRGTMLPAFDDVLFSLDVGELSDVVESPLGFHIVRKLGHEDGREAEFDEVRDKVRDFLRHVRRGEAIAAHVAELKANAVIEED